MNKISNMLHKFLAVGASCAVALSLASLPSQAGTVVSVKTSGTTNTATGVNLSVGTTANYSTAITPTAAGGDDIEFLNSSYTTTTFDANGTPLVYGSLDDLNTTQSLTVTNGSATAATLTLGGGSNAVVPTGVGQSSTLDALYVGAGGNLTISTGTAGGLTLAINVNNSGIDNVGTLAINAPITLTAGNALFFTGSGATTVGGAIASSTAKINLNAQGGGSLTFTGAELYSGLTTISAGTLTVGNGTTGSLNGTTGTALTFTGTGGFNANESSAGFAQGMGALTLSGGENTITSTNTGGTSSLTFSSVAGYTYGSTGNYVIVGGTNGTTNKIVLNGVAAGFINGGSFFDGNDFAFNTAASGGFVRGLIYGTDASTQNNTTGAAFVANDYVNVSGTSIASQGTLSIKTLQIADTSTVTLAGSLTTLTLASGGLLKSGNSASSISNGTITAGTATLNIRTDQSGDILTINSTVGGSGGLSKSGAGTLILNGTNTYTGTNYLQDGTIQAGSNSALGASTNSFSMTGNGTTLDLHGFSVGVGFNNATESGTQVSDIITNNGSSLGTITFNLGAAVSTVALAGTIKDGSAATAVAYTGSGSGAQYVTLVTANTYSGGTTIGTSAGTTVSVRTTTPTAFGSGIITIYGGGQIASSVILTNALDLVTATSIPAEASSLTVASTFSGTVDVGSLTGGPSSGTLDAVGGTGVLYLTGNIVDATSSDALTIVSDGGYGHSLILSGNNTFSGGLTFTNTTANTAQTLTLDVNSATALGAGSFTISSGGGVGVLTLDNTSAGAIVLTPNNTEFWNADFAFTGTHNLDMGTGAVTLGANRLLTINGSVFAVGGAIGDGGSGYNLSKAGNGTLLLYGTSTYTGTTTVSAGNLTIGNGTSGSSNGTSSINVSTGTGILSFNEATASTIATTITNSGLVTGSETTGHVNTLSGVISGAGNVSQTGAGTTILAGADTYTGTTIANISGGTLQVGNGTSGSISTSSAVSTIAGSTIAFDEATGSTITNNIVNAGTVAGVEGSGITNSLTGVISGAGGFNHSGLGTTMLGGASANTYTGTTAVSNGTLILATANAAGSSAAATITSGGSLLFGASGALKSTATVSLASTGTIGFTAGNTGSLVQTAGALTLAATGTYNVDFGSGHTGLDRLTFASLATAFAAGKTIDVFDWNGTAYAAGATTDNGMNDVLSFTSATNVSGYNAQVNFYSGSTTSSTFLGNGEEVSYGGTSTEIVATTPVPEPSTIFAGLCLLGLLGWSNRRQLRDLLLNARTKLPVTA